MEIRTLGTAVLFIFILFTAFLIRIQGTPNIPEGQFVGNDAYLYYWQAQIISENGKLPERDMHRWLPLGRDNRQTLNLYPYVLAYTYKVVAWMFPRISLYHVILYAPPICFCIGLGVLCLFLSRMFGLLSAGISGVFLATLPGSIIRSTAGFSDRDSWCLMLGILAVITYLASLQTQHQRKQILWTLASGLTIFLGGISWEGFGVFISIILCVEIWRFLTSEREDRLGLYLLWVFTFAPTLYLASLAYRSGDGFARHLAAFVLVPPLVLLGMRVLRHLLLTKTCWAGHLKTRGRTLALVLTFASIALALGYVFIQRNTLSDTTVPLSQNRLMQTVKELENPIFLFWIFRYGSVFVLGALGMIMAVTRFWKIRGLLLAISLTLFTLTSFYRELLDTLWGISVNNSLFIISVAICALGFILLAWRRQHVPRNESIYVAFIIWFLFWVALTRDARRYDFFIGMAIAFFTTDLICFLADFYGNQVKKRVPQWFLKTAITGITLMLILFWPPVGGHATRALFAATKSPSVISGKSEIILTFQWMKANLRRNAVVAAHWPYGSQLNVLGRVKTIIDQDHYIQHWIHLYNEHVRNATDAREALTFLKTHGATHLMLMQEQPPEVFLQGTYSDAFVPVYPTDNFRKALVKVWKIHYPPDLQSNLRYLKTEQGE